MRGPISIAVSGIIGLTTEAVAAIKKSRKGSPDPILRSDGPARASHEGFEIDEEDAWMLDDIQDQLNLQQASSMRGTDLRGNANTSIQPQLAPPSYAGAMGQLPAAVIIPQRRPQSKSRGFVRAYAPALNYCGIDQQMFLEFLTGFDSAIKKQSLFLVANLPVAAGVITATVMLGHNPLVDVAGFLVHGSIEMGRRMYMTHKTNDYLFEMNEKLFKPHGLYALIMVYKSNSSDAFEVVDIDTNVVKAVAVQEGGGTGNKFSSASGTTNCEAQMPEAVPLIFPVLEAAGDEQKQDALKKAMAFLGDYGDRRAQAKFESANPNSSLNVLPKKEFSSRYADPNHRVNKGGPLTVLTGGKISIDANRRERREKEEREQAVTRQKTKSGGSGGGIMKKLAENVLYLMIVNMPSEEQMRAAAKLELSMRAS